MTTQRLKKLSKLNNVKLTGKVYTMAEMIQESYKASYTAKQLKNKKLISITESHLINVKKNPTKTRELSNDMEAIKKLVRLGECNKFKDLEEVAPKKKKARKRKAESCMKPAIEMKESWQSSRNRMSKALKTFRESAKSKVFYKELGKFNNKLAKGKAITISEAIDLYKASNSCLTHLTVELDRNPKFISTFKECTSLLSRDNLALLGAIQKKKVPSRSILESFAVFTNILLECDAPENLDKEKYPVDEDADMETLADRDVINEDDNMETIADRDVIDEDADMETLADRDVIDEDADMETLADRDVINEEDEIEDELEEDDDILPEEELEEDGEGITIDLTPDEIALLRKILEKVSGLSEEAELVPDEEPVPDLEEDDDIIVDYEDELEEEDDIDIEDEELEEDDEEFDPELDEDDDIVIDDEDLEEEDEIEDELEEEDEVEELSDTRDDIDPELEEDEDIIPDEEDLEEEDEIDSEEDLEEDDEVEDEDLEDLEEDEECDPDMEECNESEEEEEELDTGLSESAMRRIRRGCY